MRVLHLNRSWAMGGAQTILLSLFRHLPKFGDECLFLPYVSPVSADDELVREARRTGVKICSPGLDWQGVRDWRRTQGLIADTIARERIDVVHAHDNQSNTLVGLSKAHCARVATAYGWWDLNLKVKLYYAIERYLALPRFNRVCTVSQNMRRKILAGGTPSDRVRVIHTGLEPKSFEPRNQRQQFRALHGIAPDALVIGSVSRLSPEKNQRAILRATANMARMVPETFVLLVGKGPERAALEEEAEQLGIAGRVRFAGYVEDIVTALEAMDIFVLASTLDEGFPTCVLEAQAAGLPVIASDVGGTSETLVPGTTGLLVRPGSVEALSQALSELATSAARRRVMAEAGRRYMMQEFTVERMAREMDGVYHEAMKRHKSG